MFDAFFCFLVNEVLTFLCLFLTRGTFTEHLLFIYLFKWGYLLIFNYEWLKNNWEFNLFDTTCEAFHDICFHIKKKSAFVIIKSLSCFMFGAPYFTLWPCFQHCSIRPKLDFYKSNEWKDIMCYGSATDAETIVCIKPTDFINAFSSPGSAVSMKQIFGF